MCPWRRRRARGRASPPCCEHPTPTPPTPASLTAPGSAPLPLTCRSSEPPASLTAPGSALLPLTYRSSDSLCSAAGRSRRLRTARITYRWCSPSPWAPSHSTHVIASAHTWRRRLHSPSASATTTWSSSGKSASTRQRRSRNGSTWPSRCSGCVRACPFFLVVLRVTSHLADPASVAIARRRDSPRREWRRRAALVLRALLDARADRPCVE